MYGSTMDTPLLTNNGGGIPALKKATSNTAILMRAKSERTLFQQHVATLEEEDELIEEYGPNHWRLRGFHFLHRHSVILALAGLMLLDILLLVAGLILEGSYPECDVIYQRFGCMALTSPVDLGKPPTKDGLLHAGTDASLTCSCETQCLELPESVELAKYMLTVGSIIILVVFLLELIFHWVIIGTFRFTKNVFLVFDFVIVLISIWLEIVTTTHELAHEKDDAQALTVPLLVISRSWRLLRIGHGTVKETRELYEEKMREMESEILDLNERLTRAQSETGAETVEM